MGKKLTSLTTPEARESALASVKRLDDFEYPPEFPDESFVSEDPVVMRTPIITKTEKDKDKNYWTNVGMIACINFSDLQKGESVGANEIKKRLRQLRDVGYDVPAYGKLKNGELWGCLMDIRKDIYSVLKTDYPDVKKQIEVINQRTRLD